MSSYPITCYANIERAVPVDSGVGTSSYWVMPARQRYEIYHYFEIGPRWNWFIFPISAAMFCMIFYRLLWTNTFYYILALRFYISLSVNLPLHFSNFANLRELQIPNAQTKYYGILPAQTKTPYNATRNIASRYFDIKYHFLTLQRKICWTRVYDVISKVGYGLTGLL